MTKNMTYALSKAQAIAAYKYGQVKLKCVNLKDKYIDVVFGTSSGQVIVQIDSGYNCSIL